MQQSTAIGVLQCNDKVQLTFLCALTQFKYKTQKNTWNMAVECCIKRVALETENRTPNREQ